MHNNYSIQPLTPDDIKILRNRYEKPSLKLAVFVILFMAFASWASYSLDSLLPAVSTAILFGIAAVMYIWVQGRSRKQVASGKKMVYRGVIESKREADYGMEGTENFSPSTHIFCFFTLNGREFMVPAGFYDRFLEGDMVELYATIPDDIVFCVAEVR